MKIRRWLNRDCWGIQIEMDEGVLYLYFNLSSDGNVSYELWAFGHYTIEKSIDWLPVCPDCGGCSWLYSSYNPPEPCEFCDTRHYVGWDKWLWWKWQEHVSYPLYKLIHPEEF